MVPVLDEILFRVIFHQSIPSLSHAQSLTRVLSLLIQFLSLLCFTESPVAKQVLWDYCGLEIKEKKSRKKGNMCLGLRKRFGEDFRKKEMESK